MNVWLNSVTFYTLTFTFKKHFMFFFDWFFLISNGNPALQSQSKTMLHTNSIYKAHLQFCPWAYRHGNWAPLPWTNARRTRGCPLKWASWWAPQKRVPSGAHGGAYCVVVLWHERILLGLKKRFRKMSKVLFNF